MIFASLAEIVSIGSVIPFLGALTSPDKVFSSPLMSPLISLLAITSPQQIIVPLTIIFCLSAVVSGGIRLLLLILTTRLSFSTGSDLGINIYQKTLYQPYKVHVARNSSEIINGISTKANSMIYSVILPTLTLISSGVMLLSIIAALVFVNPAVSITSFVIFGLIYVFLAKHTRSKKIKNSRTIAERSTQIIKSLQEGLGGIRDVLLDGSQKVYCDNYRLADIPLRAAQASNQVVAQSPRFIMESLGMVLIAGLAFYLFEQPDGALKAIPVLGVLALGAQRMLPVMQQSYNAWSSIQGSYASLEDTLLLLDQPLPSNTDESSILRMGLNSSISFKNVSFRYSNESDDVIHNFNFTVNKGDKIGIVGSTGSGKSTLIDILMGLLEPSSGSLEIDGKTVTINNLRSWQCHIAHVPQAIFLADSSIAENIAFGVDGNNIDFDRVKSSAEKAQLHEFIDKLPRRYLTKVGERGVRLSGGQRQRIGIARALYKNADVIVFDEATSALDNQTEESVMQSIETLGNEITVIMIAHRLTTLKKCNKIIELSNGEIVKIGSYQEIINSSPN
jgi:ATP-binding cassette subfamily B protein